MRIMFVAFCLLWICSTHLHADDASLVGHWTFDQGEGDIAQDASGHEHHGTINGATWVSCGEGYALAFDGDDDVVDFEPFDGMALREAATLSAWVYPERVPDMTTGIAGESYVHYALTFGRTSRVSWHISAGSNGIGAEMSTGRWHHIAATFDGKKLSLFIDGKLVESNETKHSVINRGGQLSIGRITSRPEYPPIGTFVGRIDNVRLYNVALDADAVAAQHQQDAPMYGRDSIMQATQWQAVPGAVRREAIPLRVQGYSDDTVIEQAVGYRVDVRDDGSARFFVPGQVATERTMQWRRALRAEELQGGKWFVLRYQAEGFRRSQNIYAVIRAEGATGSVTLLDCAQLINDGREHIMLGAVPVDITPEMLAVEVSTAGRGAYLDIIDVTFTDTWPDLIATDESLEHFEVTDLSNRHNAAVTAALEQLIAEHGMVTDPIAAFPGEAEGMIRPDHDDAINEQKSLFLGEQLPRKYTAPISRDDVIAIPVNDQVSEVLLLLVAETAPTARHYTRPSTPLHIADVEAFAVELVYNDGTCDWAFPYSVADEGHVIRRALGTYAVAADASRTLSTVRLHNRWWKINISLAGFAVNASHTRLFPQLVDDSPPLPVVRAAVPADAQPSTQRDGDRITMHAGMLIMTIDIADGFRITALDSTVADSRIAIDANSGIELEHGEEILTGSDFVVREAKLDGNRLSLSLAPKRDDVPVEIALAVEPRGDQVVFQGSATNTSDEPLSITLRVPSIKGLTLDSIDDTWLFFPKYRNELSNRLGSHVASNDRAFPLQFYDVFNRARGYGIATLTHNLSHVPLEYRMAKSEAGVDMSVDYPAYHHVIAPQSSMDLIETCIVGHSGDWHDALALYQQWRATWYEYHQARDRSWFERTFLLRAIFADEGTARSVDKTPPWYTGTPGAFRIDEALEATRRYWGFLPDMIHVGGWFHNEGGSRESWGDYQYTDHAVGGLSSFQSLLRDIENQRQMHTSLYTLADRASKGSVIGDRIGETAVRRRADGSPVADAYAWHLDPSNPLWQDHYVQTLERIIRDTQVQSIYLDVFSYSKGSTSFNERDGYRVPTWPNRTTYDMITRVRDTLPDNVPLWSEYAADDVSSQYYDGNITYYYLTLHSLFAQSYDVRQSAPAVSEPHLNVVRFALPHIKQFCFPVGIEGDRNPSRLRMIFFNGEALYNCTWRLFGDRLRRWIGRGIEVQRTYADCFASDDVTMLVPTLRQGVYANRFDGDTRTAWTIYNGRFQTVRGRVLAIDHVDGATYIDAWRGTTLNPRIENGQAIIELDIDPQAATCIVMQRAE